MNYFYLILVNVLLLSCSGKTIKQQHVQSGVSSYNYQDKSGNYLLKRTVKNKDGKVVTVEEMFNNSGKLTQKEIFVSRKGKLKGRLPLLRPEASQFYVWFSGKKYISQLRLNKKQKSYELITSEKLKKKIKVPSSNGGFCYIGQVVECSLVSGFLQKAINLRRGSFNLTLVLNGFPYWQEIYSGVQSEVLVPARFVYEGEVQTKGHYRFSLEFEGQNITYVVDRAGKLIKKFWISQGMSMVNKSDQILSEQELSD